MYFGEVLDSQRSGQKTQSPLEPDVEEYLTSQRNAGMNPTDWQLHAVTSLVETGSDAMM